MVFSSLEFIFRFFIIFIIAYYISPKRFRNFVLLVGSLFFYAWGEPVYLILIVLSILVNHRLGRLIEKYTEKRRLCKFFFLLAMFYDFGMLVLFKYADFIIDNLNAIFSFAEAHTGYALPALHRIGLTLPLGISFYTFQIASYIIDIYRGKHKSEKSVLQLGVYLCMFPQLIAGPIIVYSDMAEQIKERTYSLENFEDGLKTFVIGLGSKVLLANRISLLWNNIQVTGFDCISTPLAWLGAFSYSFQIFFDFFGYSLMAIGLGKMLGFRIPENFNYPYMATSVSDFWRRWHITLGAWFREYIYIPLGGNRKGRLRTIRNLFLVWALTGLWHGASWNFVIWGLLFFALLSIEKLFLGKVFRAVPLLGHLYIIALIPLTWILFAITDAKNLWIYFTRLFPFLNGSSPWSVHSTDYLEALQMYGPLFLVCILFSTPLPAKLYHRFKNNIITLLVLLAVFWLSIYYLAISSNNPFLYFRF